MTASYSNVTYSTTHSSFSTFTTTVHLPINTTTPILTTWYHSTYQNITPVHRQTNPLPHIPQTLWKSTAIIKTSTSTELTLYPPRSNQQSTTITKPKTTSSKETNLPSKYVPFTFYLIPHWSNYITNIHLLRIIRNYALKSNTTLSTPSLKLSHNIQLKKWKQK